MKTKSKSDKSASYRALGFEPIKAPKKPTAEPKAVVKQGDGDLRGGKK